MLTLYINKIDLFLYFHLVVLFIQLNFQNKIPSKVSIKKKTLFNDLYALIKN